MFWVFGKRCKHNWVVLVDKFIESNVERLAKNTDDRFEHSKLHFRYFPSDMSGTNIVILQCTGCGKIDKTVTKT